MLEVSKQFSKESANYLERILSAGIPPLLKIKGGWVAGGSEPPAQSCPVLLASPPFGSKREVGGLGWGGPLLSPLVWEYRGT